MVKKKTIQKKKKHTKKTLPKNSDKKGIKNLNNEKEIEKILIQNFVAFQKVMTHLSLKFENLTLQISKLLELFEISAKSLAKRDFESDQSKKDEEKVMKKIDILLDQNKIIARGLTLIHEKDPREILIKQSPNSQIQRPMQKQQFQPNQQRPMVHPQQNASETINTGGYQKSISSQIPDIDDPKRLQKNAQQNPPKV